MEPTPRILSEWKVIPNAKKNTALAQARVGQVFRDAGEFPSPEDALVARELLSPPEWDADAEQCRLCQKQFPRLMSLSLGTRHHCRNCGALVCSACAQRRWPATMVPPLYRVRPDRQVLDSPTIRVCNACHESMEAFRRSLLRGDVNEVMRLSEHNVNLARPFSVYPDAMFPIHCAAVSGSVPVMKWLLETKHVPLRQANLSPILTKGNKSPLALAFEQKHLPMVEYLISAFGCSSTECANINCVYDLFDQLARKGAREGQVVQAQVLPVGELGELGELGQLGEGGENGEGDDSGLCVVCMVNQIDCVLVPCGHYCLCMGCSSALQDKTCPVCRQAVEQTVKTFK